VRRGILRLKLHGVHHGVGVQNIAEKLGEVWSLGEGNPNTIQDQGVQAQ